MLMSIRQYIILEIPRHRRYTDNIKDLDWEFWWKIAFWECCHHALLWQLNKSSTHLLNEMISRFLLVVIEWPDVTSEHCYRVICLYKNSGQISSGLCQERLSRLQSKLHRLAYKVSRSCHGQDGQDGRPYMIKAKPNAKIPPTYQINP